MEEWSIVLGLAATVVPTAAVVITALIQHRANHDAHSGIAARIESVEARAEKRTQAAEERADKRADALAATLTNSEARAEKRADALAATLEAQRLAMEAIARDLSFLAGRQEERDRNPDAGGDVVR